MGDGTTSNHNLPNEITSTIPFLVDEKIDELVVTEYVTFLLTTQSRIFVWGNNFNGYYGDGSTTTSLSPLLVTPTFNLEPGEVITHITGGDSHFAAVSSNNRVFSWGNNYFGQLGDGTNTNSTIPIDITLVLESSLGDICISLDAGNNNSMAVGLNGNLVIWGSDNYGLAEYNSKDIYYSPRILVYLTESLFYEDPIHIPDMIEGYLFDGWFVEPERILLSDYLTMPAYDVVLYGIIVRDES